MAFAGTHPDENYARETMQLFTTGLYKLHMDGTHQHHGKEPSEKLSEPSEPSESGDGEGAPAPAPAPVDVYDNDDVATFAKVWTGLDRQAGRGNYESIIFGEHRNLVDGGW
jgi:uncharacterized protein (DUF1800 family)